MNRAELRWLASLALVGLALGGCGKSLPKATLGVTEAGGLSTANTTRLGGSSPVLDAAAVARTVYPGLTEGTRPQAVVLVDEHDFDAALAAAALAGAPLKAPLLYTEGSSLPAASALALQAMRPTGASQLGGAQLVTVGASAPGAYRSRALAGGEPAVAAAAIEGLVASIRGGSPADVIVASSDAPAALLMPAAGLAAQTGAPILFVTSSGVPAATAAVLRGLNRPAIYTVGSSAIGERVFAELARYGRVKRAEAHAGEDATVAGNAVAVASFSDGSFGFGVGEPGHGFAFASASLPLDAPAAALLSASGDYAPLLLLEGAGGVPAALASYLRGIRPGAPEYQPARGFYNHGWVIGDERAVSATTQAELDGLLETVLQHSTGSPTTPTEPSAPATQEPEE